MTDESTSFDMDSSICSVDVRFFCVALIRPSKMKLNGENVEDSFRYDASRWGRYDLTSQVSTSTLKSVCDQGGMNVKSD
ncbi:hypothetical protein A2U01_0039851 [Trifolium medium]|uniref:Uncharacterized protein n=1 Tax=Trifolium medium TaxID=97028 RepID=A0A392Q576_9FABA|nr:hypothetical protein [Trifolium medium]